MIELKRLGNIYGEHIGTGMAGNVWDQDGLCPTIKVESGGGNRVPMIVVGSTQANAYVGNGEISPTLTEAMGMGGGQIPMIIDEIISTNGTEISGTIRATYYKKGERNIKQNVMNGLGYEDVVEPQVLTPKRTEYGKQIRKDYESHKIYEKYANNCIQQQYRIRKLTPLECWRLMSISDGDYEKAAEVNSQTQLYKEAGNSIVRNVLVAIFGQMFEGKEMVYTQ